MKRSPFLNFGFGLLFLLVIRMVRSKDSNHAPEGPRYTGFSERAQEAERSPPVEAPFVAVNEVDESIRVGDCGRLRILWPLYVASRPNDGDVQAFEWARSQRLTAALTICPELDGELQ